MDSADLQKLRDTLLNYFNYEELLTLSYELEIDFDNLGGDSKAAKARELITYALRRGLLDQLVQAIRQARPQADLPVTSERDVTTHKSDADALSIELTSLRQQLDEMRKYALTDEQVERRIEEMLKTANRAIGRTEELTARVLLPPPEMTDVQLLPSGVLERLEEYRSDENIAYLLIGTFVGSILGILSNWVTNDPFIVTKFSLVLLGLFVMLTFICILWALLRPKLSHINQQLQQTPPNQGLQRTHSLRSRGS